MEAGNLKDWLGTVAILISLAGVIYSWFTAKSKVNAEHLKRLEGEQNAIEKRLSHVETELEHLPAKDDVNDLKIALLKLEGSVGRLEENVSSVSRTVHRVDDYLRTEGKAK